MLNYFLWQVYNYLEFFVCLHAHGLNSPSCDLSHVLGKNKTKQKKTQKTSFKSRRQGLQGRGHRGPAVLAKQGPDFATAQHLLSQGFPSTH